MPYLFTKAVVSLLTAQLAVIEAVGVGEQKGGCSGDLHVHMCTCMCVPGTAWQGWGWGARSPERLPWGGGEGTPEFEPALFGRGVQSVSQAGPTTSPANPVLFLPSPAVPSFPGAPSQTSLLGWRAGFEEKRGHRWDG